MSKESRYYQIANFEKYLKHPQKYRGDFPIALRSGWEIQFATWLDKNQNVLEWSSESVVIMYDFFDTVKNKVRKHRYFTDFWMKVVDKEGKQKEYIVEIKPSKETQPPAKPKRETQAHKRRVLTYLKNQAKWNAARRFCEEQRRNGKEINFVVLTEKDITF